MFAGTVATLLGSLFLPNSSAAGLSREEEWGLWQKATESLEAQSIVLPATDEDRLWVRRVGEQIVRSWPDRRWVTHEFVVLENAEPGAWSYPVSPVRHKVYVTTGLLAFVRECEGVRPDDGLAGVLAHEIAHLLCSHHRLPPKPLPVDVPSELVGRALQLLGRDDEFEADSYGALYALHAGYSFDGITTFLGHYMRRYGDDALWDADPDPGNKRIHPCLSDRIDRLTEEQERLEAAARLFEYGLNSLRCGAWETARACFGQVRNAFWLSPTVAHNLGYAELRQYEAELADELSGEQCVSTSYFTHIALKSPETSPGPNPALLAEAKASFLAACENDRDHGFIAPRLGLAIAYLYEGNDAEAGVCLERIEAGSDDPACLNITGVLAERRGDTAAARRAYCKALAIHPTASVAEATSQALDDGSPHLPALYNLAHLLEGEGHRAEAAQLYRRFLTFEGRRSRFGVRASDGLLRCGGQLSEQNDRQAMDTHRGIHLQSSGPLVVESILGPPESTDRLAAGPQQVSACRYPSQGITVLLAADRSRRLRVTYILLSAPNRDPVAQVRVGDSVALLKQTLGHPREVLPDKGGAWWDYPACGIAFFVRDDRVEQCLMGGWR